MRIRIFGLAVFLALIATGGWVLMGDGDTAEAHLHPLVPFTCAPDDTGAGNESAGIRNAPWVPEEGRFIVQHANPGKAEDSKGAAGAPALFGGNPGVGPATDNCEDPQDDD